MPKLTHVTLPEVIHPIIAKDPPKSVTTFKKEYVNEADVMFMVRSNDDRVAENINQYPRGVNVGTNLSFTNSTRFTGSLSDARPQAKYVGSYVPAGVQHRIEYIPEKEFSLSRVPFRWATSITGANPAKAINQVDNQTREYKTTKTITVIPQASKPSKYPCNGTGRDYENVDDYYDLMQHCGFIIQDPVVTNVSSKVQGNQLNADIDFEGIENKMKQLLSLDEQHQNKGGVFVGYSDDVQGYTNTKLNMKHIPLQEIISKPFTIAIIDPESQNLINTRKITEKELHNLNVIANATNSLTNNDIERVIGINLRDKDTISIQTNGSDNILYIAPTRIIPELEKLIPEYNIASNASNINMSINEGNNRDIKLLGDNRPKNILENVSSVGKFESLNVGAERKHTIINKNYQNRNSTSVQGNSTGVIPSNYRMGAIPNLKSKRLTK